MFRLAEMFVEVTAPLSPLQKSFDEIKAAAQKAGNVAGSNFECAFTKGLGIVGVAVKAFDTLLGMVDENSEAVQTLSDYYEEAIAPVKTAVNDVVASFTDWTTGVIEAAKASVFVQSAMATTADYLSAGLENAKTAIDVGVEAFFSLKDAATDAFTEAVKGATNLYNSIMTAFGSTAVTAVTSWGEVIQSSVADKLELVGIFMRNWPDIIELAGVKIGETVTHMGDYLSALGSTALSVGIYMAKVLTDGFTTIQTAFMNLGKNMTSVWDAFLDFVKTGKFEPKFTGLLDGLKVVAAEFPEMVKPVFTDFSNQIQAIEDRIAAREAAGFAKHAGAKKTPAEEAAAAVAGAAPGMGFKAETFNAAELAGKIRAGILNKDSDDKIARQLAAAERSAKANEKVVALLEKPRPAVVG